MDEVSLFENTVQYNCSNGCRTYPRYFKLEFAFNRAKYQAQPRVVDLAKLELQAQVIELHSLGWSYPAIAKHLNISIGSVWNMINTNVAEYRDKLDSLE